MSLFDYSDIPCNAPLRVPPPVLNASILSFFLIFRHGMRAPAQIYNFPGNEGYWSCNGIKDDNKFSNVQVNGKPYEYIVYNKSKDYLFPPSCSRSALTDEGLQDLYELGQFYYNYSVDRQIILPSNNSNSLSSFSIRSSFSPRCIESLLSFLNGFYHHIKGNIYQVLHIQAGEKGNEPLSASPFHSKLIFDKFCRFIQNEDYKNRFNISEEIISKFQGKYLNVTYPVHEFESLTFGDFVNTVRCARQEKNIYRTIDHLSPEKVDEKLITPEIHKILMNNVAYFENLISYSPESVVPIFELILERFQKVENFEGIINVFSAHSETLSAILSGLGQPRREFPPPYRSHLLMEVWKMNDSQKILRISFNGEVIKSLPLSDFVDEIENFIKLYGNKANKNDFSFIKEKIIETEKVFEVKKVANNENEKIINDVNDNLQLKRQNIEIIHFEDEFHEVESFQKDEDEGSQVDENESTFVGEVENNESHSKKKKKKGLFHSKKIKRIGKEIKKAGKKLLNSKKIKKAGRGLRKLKRKLRL